MSSRKGLFAREDSHVSELAQLDKEIATLREVLGAARGQISVLTAELAAAKAAAQAPPVEESPDNDSLVAAVKQYQEVLRQITSEATDVCICILQQQVELKGLQEVASYMANWDVAINLPTFMKEVARVKELVTSMASTEHLNFALRHLPNTKLGRRVRINDMKSILFGIVMRGEGTRYAPETNIFKMVRAGFKQKEIPTMIAADGYDWFLSTTDNVQNQYRHANNYDPATGEVLTHDKTAGIRIHTIRESSKQPISSQSLTQQTSKQQTPKPQPSNPQPSNPQPVIQQQWTQQTPKLQPPNKGPQSWHETPTKVSAPTTTPNVSTEKRTSETALASEREAKRVKATTMTPAVEAETSAQQSPRYRFLGDQGGSPRPPATLKTPSAAGPSLRHSETTSSPLQQTPRTSDAAASIASRSASQSADPRLRTANLPRQSAQHFGAPKIQPFAPASGFPRQIPSSFSPMAKMKSKTDASQQNPGHMNLFGAMDSSQLTWDPAFPYTANTPQQNLGYMDSFGRIRSPQLAWNPAYSQMVNAPHQQSGPMNSFAPQQIQSPVLPYPANHPEGSMNLLTGMPNSQPVATPTPTLPEDGCGPLDAGQGTDPAASLPAPRAESYVEDDTVIDEFGGIDDLEV